MKKKLISYSLILLTSLIMGIIGYYLYTGEISTIKEFRPGDFKKEKKAPQKKVIKEIPDKGKQEVISTDVEVKENARIYITSDRNTYNVNEGFQISVYGDGNGEIIDGVEYILEYNPDKIELQNPIPGQFFTYLKNEIDNQKGEAQIITIQELNVEKPMNNELLTTYTIVPKEEGTVKIGINQKESSMAAYGGKELLGQIGPLTISIK